MAHIQGYSAAGVEHINGAGVQDHGHRQFVRFAYVEIELVARRGRAAALARVGRELSGYGCYAVRGGQCDAWYGLRAARNSQVRLDVVPDIGDRSDADSAGVVLVEDPQDRVVGAAWNGDRKVIRRRLKGAAILGDIDASRAAVRAASRTARRPIYSGAPALMVMAAGMVTELETTVQVPVHAGVAIITPVKPVVPLHLYRCVVAPARRMGIGSVQRVKGAGLEVVRLATSETAGELRSAR